MSPGLEALITPGFITLRSSDANALGVAAGDGIEVGGGDGDGEKLSTVEVTIDDSLAAGCAGFSVGLAGTANLQALTEVTLHKAQSWQRRSPQVIGSDRGRDV